MLDKNNAFKIETKKYNSNSTTKTYWFYCDCGEVIKAQSGQLKNHSGKCSSCSQRGRPYEAIFNELYRAKRIHLQEVVLSYEDFIEIISTKECHYCHTSMFWFPHVKNKGKDIPGSRAYQIDRKDNNIGYIKDNCVPCCWTCNRLKAEVFSYEEFLEIGKLIAKFRNNRKELGLEDFPRTSHSEKYIKSLENDKI